jgi:hypothetical protein
MSPPAYVVLGHGREIDGPFLEVDKSVHLSFITGSKDLARHSVPITIDGLCEDLDYYHDFAREDGLYQDEYSDKIDKYFFSESLSKDECHGTFS